MIRHLTHGEIDKGKWDACIGSAINGLVYGYSWYLDAVSPGWEGLVLGEYEAVFPLTHAKRFSFRYLYQPFFTQQLGVFYRTEQARTQTAAMLSAIPSVYKFAEINLNSDNADAAPEVKLGKRKNFVLGLDKPYAKLHKQYSENAKRNVKKGKGQHLRISEAKADAIIEFYKLHKGQQTEDLADRDYDMLSRLAKAIAERGFLIPLGVYHEEELIACALFVATPGRVIYLLGTASEAGRKMRGLYMLFDHVIQRYSEQAVVLDFEGSEMQGIARFFKGFGASKAPYHRLRLNRLPWFIRWLKG